MSRPQPNEPELGQPADDNRVPGLADVPITSAVAHHAGAWLRGNRRGRAPWTAAPPSTFGVWLVWIGVPVALALGAAGALAVSSPGPWLAAVLWVALVLFAVLAISMAAGAAAVADTLPPPRFPDSERDTLPTGAPRPPRHLADDSPLFEYVSNEVWIAERPLRFYGMELGARMTILRLGDGGLVLHSPVALDADLEAGVRRLGEPRLIVAPNSIHHMYVGPWRERFPDAEFLAAPCLLERRPDLTPALECPLPAGHWLTSDPDIALAVFEGHPFHREVAVFHVRSGTLVLADMIESLAHEGDPQTLAARLMLGLGQMSGRPTPPIDYKLVADEAALRASLQPMLDWPFERIVIAHGRLIERDARETFRRAFAFVLD